MNNIFKAALAAAVCLTMVNCSTQKNENASADYIGPSDIKAENGLMSPEVMLNLGRLSDPQLSPDGAWILYGVSYTSIEQNRMCRNLFLTPVSKASDGSLAFGEKVQLTKEGSSVSNARWSNDGKSIYYIQKGQVWKAAFDGSSLSGAKKITDWPAGISEFRLSPDESMILFTSTVPGIVKTPKDFDPKLDKAQAYVTEDLMYRHWDHWTTERPQAYFAKLDTMVDSTKAINVLGDDAGKYELPIEPFSGIEQLCWSPDGSKIAYSCKKVATGKEYAFSTDTEIYLFDVASGKTAVIPMGGGYDTDPVWSPDGSKIAWLSMARNGYEADKVRLFVADVADGLNVSGIKELTSDFKYNAASPTWSSDSKSLYFCALAEGLQAIYKVAVADSPASEATALVRITPENAWYDFGGVFGFTDGRLLASYQSMEFPTELVAVNEADGSFAPITKENEHILGQLKPYKTEEKWLKTIDGKDMLTWILYPPEFDSTKVYPAIEILLGGPQGTLSQGWSYRWNYRLMCNQGYIVVLPNRRGTTAFGQDWCEEISGDYIGLNMQDYLTAANYIKSKPYVGKLAACGASYGGYSVYYMAGIHGNTYDCFVAHAGIFDEKYMYGETEEMWFPNWDNGGLTEYSYTPGEVGPRGDGVTFGGMQQAGSPWSSAAKARRHYANSPDVNVTKWHTPILCMHGMMDYRIPYDQGMEAFNCAQMMGVPSKLVVFPEENHWILQPQNALFWHREYYDWLDRWCKPGKSE
jgi:dipeptidyl aminopeptidase/acylaminoacyl peptidase